MPLIDRMSYSLGAYLEVATGTRIHFRANQLSSYDGSESFAGMPLEKALDVALVGDIDMVRQWEASFRVPSISGARAPMWSASKIGYLPNIPAYIAGDMKHAMWKRTFAKNRGKVIRVFADMAVDCSIQSEQIANRGRGILALIDYLESSAYRVELSLFYGITGHKSCTCDECKTPDQVENYKDLGDSLMVTGFILKHAQDPFDVSLLGFWLANPAAFRRVGFAAMERDTKVHIDIFQITPGGGYGRPIRNTNLYKYVRKFYCLDEDVVFLPGLAMDSNASVKDPIKWAQQIIDEQLKDYGLVVR